MKTGILTGLMALSILSYGQNSKTWSLKDCINYAIENNPEAIISDHQIQLAETQYKQATYNFLPGVSANSSLGISGGRSVDPNTNDIINTQFINNYNGLNASIDLFNGFLLHHQLKFEKHQLRAAKESRQMQMDQLAFEVMNAYYKAWFYTEAITVAKAQLETSEQNIIKLEAMIENGLKSEADLLEIQSVFESEKFKLLQAKNLRKENLHKLQQLMNLPPDQAINTENEIPGFTEYESMQSADSVFNVFRDFSPELALAENRISSAKQSLSIAKSACYPSIRLGANFHTGYFETFTDNNGKPIPINQQYDLNLSQYIGVSLHIPIFNKNRYRTNIKTKRMQVQIAESELQADQQRIFYEIHGDLMKLEAFIAEYQQLKKHSEFTQQAYEIAEKKFSKSLISAIELATVKNRDASAKNQLLLAKMKCLMQNKMIEFYLGNRFWEV